MAQAKRSPILGYNHNVKYRGVIFHVQTEDSGQQNPHLFTHLFHGGVIVSTRKYVYDASSNEEAIKGLMQAQHKAVMKDLRKGTFDDKIDAYLGGTPGLEPRAGADPAAPPLPRGERAQTEAEPPPPEAVAESSFEIINDDLSEPIELPIKKSRTTSEDRTRPIELPMKQPTLSANADMAAAVTAANAHQAAPEPPAQDPPPSKPRVSTAQKVSIGSTPPPGSRPQVARPQSAQDHRQAAPDIDITEEEISSRLRAPRDTAAVESVGDEIDATIRVRTGQAPAAHTAGALPGKPGARPSMSPVVTRPTPDASRKRADDSEAVEIHQPAPPSVEPPPGERAERAGTYSVSRKSGDAPIREKTGRIAALGPSAEPKSVPIQSGLSRPGSAGTKPSDTGSNRVPQPARDSGSSGVVRQGVQREPTPGTAARPGTPPPPPAPNRGTPQPIRPSVTAPIANRTSTPATPAINSGVVMTRPAVIVGSPPKPTPTPTMQRVRKAREDEGRGFGHGLISEKSLDEVILAYLSEDAEDK